MNSIIEQNRQRIISYIASGCKQEKTLRLGLELEGFLIDGQSGLNVSYYSEKGHQFILKRLGENIQNAKLLYENGNILGLQADDFAISLEPGGQMEISVSPKENIGDIKAVYDNFRRSLNPILEKLGMEWVHVGYSPKSTIDRIDMIPKKRYDYMRSYFDGHGTRGKYMMLSTCAMQVSIDYFDEEDFSLKYRCAALLMPVLKSIFANTQFFEGERTDDFLLRTKIWNDVDRGSRCQYPKGLHSPDFGFGSYADFVLASSPIFVMRDESYLTTGEKTVAEIYSDTLMTDSDISHVLSMVFPEVRAKKILELRGCDSNDMPRVTCFLEFVKTIFSNRGKMKYIVSGGCE